MRRSRDIRFSSFNWFVLFLQFQSACQEQKKLKMFELEQYYNKMRTKTTFPYKTLTKGFLRNFADK